MELLVLLHIEEKDDGSFPDSAADVIAVATDILVDETKHNENLFWRVTRLEQKGELTHRVYASDGISSAEQVV
jgi:hypothetical protein